MSKKFFIIFISVVGAVVALAAALTAFALGLSSSDITDGIADYEPQESKK